MFEGAVGRGEGAALVREAGGRGCGLATGHTPACGVLVTHPVQQLPPPRDVIRRACVRREARERALRHHMRIFGPGGCFRARYDERGSESV